MALNNALKDRLRESGKPQGTVAFSSDSAEAKAAAKLVPVSGDVKVTVPPVADSDPLIHRAAKAESEAIADELAKDGAAATGDIAPKDLSGFDGTEVTITDEDREAFLDALVSGKRYERKFSLYNGRIRGKIRSRSTEESEAIAAYMNNGVRDGKFKTPLDYAIVVRNAMLAAQVSEVNGTRFPELAQPLFRTQEGEKITEPGWTGQARMWSQDVKYPEPVVAAVYEELRMFERKYWTMVTYAGDQNFWQPAAST